MEDAQNTSSSFAADGDGMLEQVLQQADALHLLKYLREKGVGVRFLATALPQEMTAIGAGSVGVRQRLQQVSREALGWKTREARHSCFSASTSPPLRGSRSTRPGSVARHSTADRRRHTLNNNAGIAMRPWAFSLELPDQQNVTPEEQAYLVDAPAGPLSIAVYILLFGVPAACLYAVVALLQVLTVVNYRYGLWCFTLARYCLCPFGRCVAAPPPPPPAPPSEGTLLVPPSGDGRVPGNVWVFRTLAAPLLAVSSAVIGFAAWFFVFPVPVAYMHKQLAELVFTVGDPAEVEVLPYPPPSPDDTTVHICCAAPFKPACCKHTVFGVNIFMVNLLLFVPANFAFKFVLSEHQIEENSTMVMVCSCAAIIPLSYYIGHSVAAVSAQTSFFVGAVLNATFGSIIELILYFVSLSKGLNNLVQSATTGALLACMLLLPGLSMLFGGAKYKEQRFNRKAGNISAIMLFVAIAGLFMPSIYYHIYRRYRTTCEHCELMGTQRQSPNPDFLDAGNAYFHCDSCNYTDHDYATDPVYTKHVEPLMYAVAGMLLLTYVAALVFTLHTHSFIYDEDEERFDENMSMTDVPVKQNPHLSHDITLMEREEGGGRFNGNMSMTDVSVKQNPLSVHDISPMEALFPGKEEKGHGPAWGPKTCIAIMVSGTVCFAVCAEALIDALGPTMDKLGVSENFAGLTLVALIPCVAEFVNAIGFARDNNIKLSLEIGNIAAIQMVLVQIPILVFGSVLMGKYYPTDGFVLLFPRINLCAVFISTLVLTYVLIDGTSNYFQGLVLIFIYTIMLLAFYHIPSEHADEL